MKHKFFNKGFSLIELMVVISIIAILMGLGAVSFTTAQKKARDSKRRTDIKSMQNAFEQYFTVNGGYAGCATMAVDPYMPAGLPTDPKPNWVNNDAYNCSYDAATDTFCACARLENETGNSDDVNCDFDSSGNEAYYCLESQQ